MSGKRNVSVCGGHELANALYVFGNLAIVIGRGRDRDMAGSCLRGHPILHSDERMSTGLDSSGHRPSRPAKPA